LAGSEAVPFAPKATGNVATEDLVYMLEGDGVETGRRPRRADRDLEWLESVLGRRLEGQLYRAGVLPQRVDRRAGSRRDPTSPVGLHPELPRNCDRATVVG
jgi:hydroxymethylglutaryl-CoA lyase/(R)-citramalyl-CoA lyase